MKHETRFSMYMTPRRWLVLAIGVLGFSTFCSTTAFFYTLFTNARFSPEVHLQSAMDTTILSFALAVPVLTLLGIKLFEVEYINQVLARMASTDMLTDCLNRRALLEIFDKYMDEQGKSAAPEGGALLILDVDHFKGVNDRLGHIGGDAALAHIALVTKQAVRDGDLVSRIGGEEFAVFLPGISPEEARRIAQRIVDAVHGTAFTANGKTIGLAVSVGGALFEQPEPFERLYKVADANLYQAKQNGRDQAIMPSIAA